MAINGILGFLGFGNMGHAIADGLLDASRMSPDHIIVFDVDNTRTDAARARGMTIAKSPDDMARQCDYILLAVKPQSLEEALNQMLPGFNPRTLLISIAAGISTTWIRQRLGDAARIARVMPNTPAMVRAGAAVVAYSDNVQQDDAVVAKTIFDAVGICEEAPEEALDVVTALSGSGPAYFFYVVECLARAAAQLGLPEDMAVRLDSQTCLGAGRLLAESGEPPHVLRARVTSKGGTTQAALEQMQNDGLESLLFSAVKAAAERSHQLGR